MIFYGPTIFQNFYKLLPQNHAWPSQPVILACNLTHLNLPTHEMTYQLLHICDLKYLYIHFSRRDLVLVLKKNFGHVLVCNFGNYFFNMTQNACVKYNSKYSMFKCNLKCLIFLRTIFYFDELYKHLDQACKKVRL